MLKAKVGYSNKTDAYEAGIETATIAAEKLKPKFGLLFNSVGYNQEKLIAGIKSVVPEMDIIGCTSSQGILVSEGYITTKTGAAEMLTFDDEDMDISCYGMVKEKNARETGRQVAIKALEKSGFNYAPDYFYMSASPKEEEEYIKGIQDVIGRVPCFGGSAADDNDNGNWLLFYNDNIFSDGVVVAFFYTNKEINTIYTGAYTETKDIGIITKLNSNRVLAEIDGEKALEKYKKWRKLNDEELKGKKLATTTITSPLGIKDRLGNLIAIRHPIKGNNDGSMYVRANLSTETVVIRMESSTDELINSVGKTLRKLKKKTPNAGAYILIHSGYRCVKIGDRMNEIYEQVKNELGDIPFITIFTSSEYGYTEDDQTNTTGGLMLSFTAFEK